MATITICDMCRHSVPIKSGAKLYSLSIKLHNGPVARNESHPTLHKEICKDCANLVQEFIETNSSDPLV